MTNIPEGETPTVEHYIVDAAKATKCARGCYNNGDAYQGFAACCPHCRAIATALFISENGPPEQVEERMSNRQLVMSDDFAQFIAKAVRES